MIHLRPGGALTVNDEWGEAMGVISSVSSNSLYYASSSTQTNGLQAAAASSTVNTSQQVVVNTGKRQEEIANFNEALEGLTKSLRDFNGSIVFSGSTIFDRMYEDKNGDPFRSLAYTDAKKIVKAYNQLNSAIKSSQFVNADGKKLLDRVNNLLTGPNAAKFKDMGISIDDSSGELKLNSTKFSEFVIKDPDSVYSLLRGKDKLVSVMRNVIGDTTGRQADYFFYKPFEATV
jgi:flagellar capping protein FliD